MFTQKIHDFTRFPCDCSIKGCRTSAGQLGSAEGRFSLFWNDFISDSQNSVKNYVWSQVQFSHTLNTFFLFADLHHSMQLHVLRLETQLGSTSMYSHERVVITSVVHSKLCLDFPRLSVQLNADLFLASRQHLRNKPHGPWCARISHGSGTEEVRRSVYLNLYNVSTVDDNKNLVSQEDFLDLCCIQLLCCDWAHKCSKCYFPQGSNACLRVQRRPSTHCVV